MSQLKNDIAGKQLNGFLIEKKPIGQGKFSTVYKAKDQQGQNVALKKIKIYDMEDPKKRQKCLKQVNLMQPLSHPNIIKYIDSFIFNNQLIIVTQWAQKGDLKKLIKQHVYSENYFQQYQIWYYIHQVSAALKHMHQKRIMHRDLKPANIFISNNGLLKVGDLGLGRQFSSLTLQAHSKVGTPLYMSPQLLKDQGYQLKSDIWSLGCIAYELCELKSPFRNERQKISLVELFNNITRGQYKKISNRYSQNLNWVVSNMIKIDPVKRLSAEAVFRKSQQCMKNLYKIPKNNDIIIFMQDIYTKLEFVEYHKYISFFQDILQNNVQTVNLQVLLRILKIKLLCYWLMNLTKYNSQKAAIYVKPLINYNSKTEMSQKLCNDLKLLGIKVQKENSQINKINKGYGQEVCFILNELLNRQLIRRNFNFNNPQQLVAIQQPQFYQIRKEQEQQIQIVVPNINQIQQTLYYEQSVIFNKAKVNNLMMEPQLFNKIKQIDENEENEMITAYINPYQWEKQCSRLQKNLGNITLNINQIYKRSNNYKQIATLRKNSRHIHEYKKIIKPYIIKLANDLQKQIDNINYKESIINKQTQALQQEIRQKNQIKKMKINYIYNLNNSISQMIKMQEQIDQRIDDYKQKIKKNQLQNEINPTIQIKKAIQIMKVYNSYKKQLNQIQIKTSLLQSVLFKKRNKDIQQYYQQQFQ